MYPEIISNSAVTSPATTVSSHASRESDIPRFSPSAMSAALTPDLALAYLDQLNWGIRAGAVLGAKGELLAGSPEVAAALAAVQLEGERSGAGDAHARIVTPGGDLHVARSEHHQIAVLAGPSVIEELLAADMRWCLADLALGR